MDSFVLSETFKYLFMIFAEPDDLIFDPDNYVLTTEAHFLPLNLGDSKENPVSADCTLPVEFSDLFTIYPHSKK